MQTHWHISTSLKRVFNICMEVAMLQSLVPTTQKVVQASLPRVTFPNLLQISKLINKPELYIVLYK